MASSQFESNLKGFLILLDDKKLEESLDKALRSVVKDILLLIFKQKYLQQHPNELLPVVAYSCMGLKNMMKTNKGFMQLLEDNDESKFDITALYHFLRHLCGLPNSEDEWNKHDNTLPGHIIRLKEVRNDVSHDTKITKEKLMDRWTTIVESSKEILLLSNNSESLPTYLAEFQRLLGAGTVFDNLIKELLDMYKSKEKSTLKPLLWAGVNFNFHRHVSKTYTPTTISVVEVNGRPLECSSDEILSKCAAKTIILEGESGTGKTALLRYLAAVWKSSDNPEKAINELNTFDLVLFLDCDGIKVQSPNMKSILQEILPKTSAAFGCQKVQKEISNETLKILFLIDAFDERLDYMADIFKTFQQNFSDATFIISTRPHCSAMIKSLCVDLVTMAIIKGFDVPSARSFIKKILCNSDGLDDEYLDFLSYISKHPGIIQIPQLLCWTLYLWKENKQSLLNNRWILYKQLTEFMIKKLCCINKTRIMATSLSSGGQLWLDAVSEVAYKCLIKNQMVLSYDHPDLIRLLNRATKLKFRNSLEALSTLMQSQSSMTGNGENLQFQFHHLSHVEYLAAYHIFQQLKGNDSSIVSKTFTNDLSSISEDQIIRLLQFVLNLTDACNIEKAEYLPILLFVSAFISKFVKNDNLHMILSLIDCCITKDIFHQILIKNCNDKFKSDPVCVLWIRNRDIQHQKSLEVFLKYTTPRRIWANLGQIDISMPDSKPQKGNVNWFLTVLRKAYGNKLLIDLTITNGIFDNSSVFNDNLSWLTLIECECQKPFHFPKTLLKLSIKSSSGLGNVDIPKQVKSLLFHSISEKLPAIPISVNHIAVKLCEDLPSLAHLCYLQSLSILNWPLLSPLSVAAHSGKEMPSLDQLLILEYLKIGNDHIIALPNCLKKLKWTGSSLSIFNSIPQIRALHTLEMDFSSPNSFVASPCGSDTLGETLTVLRSVSNLKILSIKGIDASAEEVLDFVTELESIDSSKNNDVKINLHFDSAIQQANKEIMQESLNVLRYINITITFSNGLMVNKDWPLHAHSHNTR